jgi:alkanal monooxygenase alpha chain
MIMDWGIYLITAQPPGMNEAEVIRSSVEYAQRAEALGYSRAWVLEHHFTRYGLVGSPLTHAAFLLGRTNRIKVGTAINVLPLEHPARVAEEVALLDHLSGGRFILGVGRGAFRKDYQVFGGDMTRNREMIAEAMDVLVAAWTQPEVAGTGEFYPFPSVEVLPKPLTKPHPIVYSASQSPDSVRWAARRGMPLLMNYTLTDEAKLAHLEYYAEAAMEAGHDPTRVPHALSFLAGTSRDGNVIRRQSAEHLAWWLEEYVTATLMFTPEWDAVKGYEWYRRHWEEMVMRNEHRPMDRVERYFALNPIGSPQECIDKLGKTLEMTGLKHAILAFEAAGEPSAVKDSMELFTAEVLPALDPGMTQRTAASMALA